MKGHMGKLSMKGTTVVVEAVTTRIDVEVESDRVRVWVPAHEVDQEFQVGMFSEVTVGGETEWLVGLHDDRGRRVFELGFASREGYDLDPHQGCFFRTVAQPRLAIMIDQEHPRLTVYTLLVNFRERAAASI